MEGTSQRFIITMIVMVVLNNFGQFSTAQTICKVSIDGLMTCKPAVTPPNPAPPVAACCSAVAGADFKCLCAYKNMLPSLGIDPNLAFQVPKKCKLSKAVNCA